MKLMSDDSGIDSIPVDLPPHVVPNHRMSCKCRPYDVVIPSPIPIMWIKFKKRRTS